MKQPEVNSKTNPVDWNDPFTVDRYKQFAEYFTENLTVLDFGCHRGTGGQVIKKIYPSTLLYGVELSEDAIALIPNGIYEEIFNYSIADLDSDQLKFDRIVAGEVIEHIPKAQFYKILERCKSLLKEDGLILFTTPNPDFLLVKLGRDTVLKEASHVNIMSVEEFKSAIKESGLKVNKILGSGKSSRFIGSKIPIINLYGSYLAILSK